MFDRAQRQLVYLARHGQAGGSGYNQLTAKGRQQAEHLGRYLAASEIDFDFIACGTLGRQQETLAVCREILKKEGRQLAEPLELAGLDEIAPEIWYVLAEELHKREHGFRQEFHFWANALRKRDKSDPVRYGQVMKRLLTTWVEGDYQDNSILTFGQFHKKVLSVYERISTERAAKRILLISSGTPISLLMGAALQWELKRSLMLLRWLHNTSLSIFSIEDGRWEPVSLNSLPHLPVGESATII